MIDTSTPALAQLFTAHRYRFGSERDLQNGIERVLTTDGLVFEREVILGPADRIDFLVGSTGIEIKIAGPLLALMKQLDRYAAHERIGSLLVVTNLHRLARLPARLGGKPVRSIVVEGIAF